MKLGLGEIASRLGLELVGDATIMVDSIAPLVSAQPDQITFLANRHFVKQLPQCRAAAVILKPEFRHLAAIPVLLSNNPYLSYAELTALFDNAPQAIPSIHLTAVIHPSASIPDSVVIGPGVVIGANVSMGAHSVIGANTVIEDHCQIGEHCHLHANVTLYHHVKLGDFVTIHSASVIGADGFGFAPTAQAQQAWRKIHQLGSVRIGNHVDIGANTCIDRGALEDTIIHDGVIIDNQVQIAHNCIIGENTAIAGCVGIAGSTIIGKHCTLAGGVGVAGHLEIADNVHVTSMSLVTGNLPEAGSYSSGTAMMATKVWRKNAVRFGQLEENHQRLKKIEKILREKPSPKVE